MWNALADESAGQIASAVFIAVLAFILGTFRRTIVRRIRTRETRRYWSSFRARGVAIVLGAFSSEDLLSQRLDRPVDPAGVDNFEPYGFVGFGEVLAIFALLEHLKILGLEDIVVAHAEQVSSFQSRNLVIVGGPDPNSLTELTMRHLQLPVRFEDLGSRTRMHITFSHNSADASAAEEKAYDPMFLPGKPGQLGQDYGFVAQVSSPFSEDCRAVLLVGVYGAAISAAARLVTSGHGVSRMSKVNDGRCLAVFRTYVGRNGAVSSPTIERIQPLREPRESEQNG
ncbi:hypothetical protein SAMN05421812_106122 [Asanoa hainanensis]|uniref:Uncharacterized protein n=1 Tax=Asanoa hainanensis TaxID=560556 RepID=A0A239MQK0_9ACTN|nr:hypothetical protein SAMN05421812_106122 [Asanoa hainanensis]